MRKEVIAGLLVLLMLAAAGGYVIMNNDVAEPNDADNSDGTSEENNLIDDELAEYGKAICRDCLKEIPKKDLTDEELKKLEESK